MTQTIFSRISGRQGQPLDLDVSFYRGGVLQDPYAIRRIELYKTSPVAANLIASIYPADPDNPIYPYPVQHELIIATQGACGTDPVSPDQIVSGRYHMVYDVPVDWSAPDVYFDIWYWYPDNPCSGGGSCDLDDPQLVKQLLSCCNRFWIYPDEWFCTDALQSVRFGFEPLDQRFNTPEVRPLQVGIMPLPLYDYNYNLVAPLIPYLRPTITIQTTNSETLYQDEPMAIKLRQGSFRSNPWVLSYLLDTDKFLKGTYQYKVTMWLPDGTSRTSQSFIFTVR